MPFDTNIPDGQHLGMSQNVDGAYVGHLFDDDTNELKGHAVWHWVEPDVSYSSENYEPSRPLTPEEMERAAEAAALILLAIITTVQVVAPHIKRWWINRLMPAAKAGWARVKTLRAANGGATTVDVAARSHTVFVASTEGVQSLVAGSTLTMSSAEWQRRFRAMQVARAFSEDQLRLLSGAQVIDGAGLAASADDKQQIAPQQFADRIKHMLETNPALLSDEASVELVRVLGVEARLSIESVDTREEE